MLAAPERKEGFKQDILEASIPLSCKVKGCLVSIGTKHSWQVSLPNHRYTMCFFFLSLSLYYKHFIHRHYIYCSVPNSYSTRTQAIELVNETLGVRRSWPACCIEGSRRGQGRCVCGAAIPNCLQHSCGKDKTLCLQAKPYFVVARCWTNYTLIK